MRTFEVYKSGSTKVCEIKASCVTNACEEFELSLKKSSTHKIHNKEYATIKYNSNNSMYNDFVVMLK